jgi:hypothetical protein
MLEYRIRDVFCLILFNSDARAQFHFLALWISSDRAWHYARILLPPRQASSQESITNDPRSTDCHSEKTSRASHESHSSIRWFWDIYSCRLRSTDTRPTDDQLSLPALGLCHVTQSPSNKCPLVGAAVNSNALPVRVTGRASIGYMHSNPKVKSLCCRI